MTPGFGEGCVVGAVTGAGTFAGLPATTTGPAGAVSFFSSAAAAAFGTGFGFGGCRLVSRLAATRAAARRRSRSALSAAVCRRGGVCEVVEAGAGAAEGVPLGVGAGFVA